MALKSSREGLRKELVDYLGNLIIDVNLKNEIINLIGSNFVTNDSFNSSVNSLETQITTESSERVNADTILQNNINTESTSRQEAISNIEDLINNGVLKLDLLWTNANPNSSFTEQTISVNFSTYKLLIICFRRDVSSSAVCYAFTTTTLQDPTATMYAWDINTMLYRALFIRDNSITFSSGIIMSAVGSEATDDSKMIPYKIYGVR